MTSVRFLTCRRLTALFLAVPLLAHAHPGHEGGHDLTWDFATGASHPFGGLDHLLAMLAVGLWASQLGGRSRWTIPGAFVAAMAAGAVAGGAGLELPFLEQGIAASVLIFGLLVIAAAKLPAAVGMALVAGFAAFHGIAHGAEMPATSQGIAYGLGFVAATSVLHVIGLGLGSALREPRHWVHQAAGAALVVAGAWMLAG